MAGATRSVLIMAGGTGGHVFPALAVADELAARGFKVVWLGTQTGLEAKLVPQRGYEIEWIKFSGVRGKGALRWALLPAALILACAQSWRVIRKRRPDVVLGMGGFAAFPGGLMASLLSRPLLLHEQNSIAGLTNRVLSVVADRILSGFPRAFEQKIRNPLSALAKPNRPVEWVGNPVRREIAALAAPRERFAGRAGALRLLVVGGSLGAHALNVAVPRALALLPKAVRPYVTHQAGGKHLEIVRNAYSDAQVEADFKAFIDDMASAYAQCDVVICRAGALTIAELCAAGVASVLVPFPYAVDDHQTGNARHMSEVGAAILLPQSELSPGRLADLIASFTRQRLLEMADKARALAKPQAAQQVAQACLDLAHAA